MNKIKVLLDYDVDTGYLLNDIGDAYLYWPNLNSKEYKEERTPTPIVLNKPNINDLCKLRDSGFQANDIVMLVKEGVV